jgi:hypothetical protein
MSPLVIAYHEALRKLWEDHVQWTRHVIVSAAKDLPDLDVNVQRLMKNQEDLGAAFAPFVGAQAAAMLTALLTQHIAQANDVVMAAKANDQVKLAQAKQAWYANADQIAAFLAQANPRAWPYPMMQMHMKNHLDLTLAEASQYLQGQYPQSVMTYAQVRDQILQLADLLAAGIVTAYPGAFGASYPPSAVSYQR